MHPTCDLFVLLYIPTLFYLPLTPLSADSPEADKTSSAAKKTGVSTVGFVAENDSYGPQGTDSFYTNGFQAHWLDPDTTEKQSLFDPVIDSILGLGGTLATSRSIDYQIAQNIYTPDSRDATQFIPIERPYAAWIRGQVDLVRTYAPQICNQKFYVQSSVGVSLGELGEGLGREIQNGFHKIINIPQWQGWDNHIPDTLAIETQLGHALSYSIRWAQDDAEDHGAQAVAFTLQNQVFFGNVLVRDAVAQKVQIGYFRAPSGAIYSVNTQIKQQNSKLEEILNLVGKGFSESEIYGFLQVKENFTVSNFTLYHPQTQVVNVPINSVVTIGLEGSLAVCPNLSGDLPNVSVHIALPFLSLSVQSPDFSTDSNSNDTGEFWKAIFTGDWKSKAIFHEWGKLALEVSWLM